MRAAQSPGSARHSCHCKAALARLQPHRAEALNEDHLRCVLGVLRQERSDRAQFEQHARVRVPETSGMQHRM